MGQIGLEKYFSSSDSGGNGFRRNRVFKNRDFLSSKIIPDELPHREEEFDKIRDNLEYVLDGSTPANMVIFGPRGSGKTATVRKVLKELQEVIDKEGLDVLVSYTVAEKSEMRTLISICESMDINIPHRGLSFAEVRNKLFQEIGDRKTVIVIDEIDKLIKFGNDAELLYFLTRKPNICVVGISNVFTILDSIIDKRVLSSWNPRRLVFGPYNAMQLFDILKYRASVAFYDGVVDDEVLSYIAAMAVQRGGDARYALDLLLVAGDMVRREQNPKVGIEHINKAIEEIEKGFLRNTVCSLSDQEKALLFVVALASQTFSAKISPEVAYRLSNEVLVWAKKEKLSHRRWSDYRSNLELYGYFDLLREGKGRGRGWSHYLKLNDTIDGEIVLETISEYYTSLAGYDEYLRLRTTIESKIKQSLLGAVN